MVRGREKRTVRPELMEYLKKIENRILRRKSKREFRGEIAQRKVNVKIEIKN